MPQSSENSRSSARRWRDWLTSTLSSPRRLASTSASLRRNILIHGYAEVDDRLVWDVAETKLPVLRREVDVLLDSPPEWSRSEPGGATWGRETSIRRTPCHGAAASPIAC